MNRPLRSLGILKADNASCFKPEETVEELMVARAQFLCAAGRDLIQALRPAYELLPYEAKIAWGPFVQALKSAKRDYPASPLTWRAAQVKRNMRAYRARRKALGDFL